MLHLTASDVLWLCAACYVLGALSERWAYRFALRASRRIQLGEER